MQNGSNNVDLGKNNVAFNVKIVSPSQSYNPITQNVAKCCQFHSA